MATVNSSSSHMMTKNNIIMYNNSLLVCCSVSPKKSLVFMQLSARSSHSTQFSNSHTYTHTQTLNVWTDLLLSRTAVATVRCLERFWKAIVFQLGAFSSKLHSMRTSQSGWEGSNLCSLAAGTGHTSVHAPFHLCNGFSKPHRVLYVVLQTQHVWGAETRRGPCSNCCLYQHFIPWLGITGMSGAATIQLYIFEHFS